MKIKRLHIFHNELPEMRTYIDYRLYLADLFDALKRTNRGFSYRGFSQLAGSTSPNFLQLLLKKTISLQNSNIAALSKSMNYKNYEEHYLENLVGFDKAQNHEEKEKYYKRILQIRAQKRSGEIEAHQYAYFNGWHHAAIRELIVSPEYNDDPSWIVHRLQPPISLSKVEKSIELLLELGLIKRDHESGKWLQTDTAISTPSTVPDIAIRRYHKELSDIAGLSLDDLENHQGQYFSVTCGLDDDGVKEIQKKCEQFWKEIFEFVSTQKNVKHVYQTNIYFFPITKPKE